MSKSMLVMDLHCPHCKAGLTTGAKVKLDAHVGEANQDGEVLLSAIFGEYSIETELKIKDGALVEFRCPECDASLLLSITCKLCRAPMASLNIKDQGYIEFCSRRGCKGHALGGVGNIDEMMQIMNKMFDTPYD
jgi:predicted RNA-binding Zn-ribbon protein involved in translation (DUF1610 family)